MVTAKANTLLFEGWWRDEVVSDAKARVPFSDLYRAYCNAMVVPMGRQAFVARLNGLGVKEERERGVRYRLGIRLRLPPAQDLAPPAVKLRGSAPRTKSPPLVSGLRKDIAPALPTAHAGVAHSMTGESYLFQSLTPGGEAANCVLLQVGGVAEQASAHVVCELFAERLRQQHPKDVGGEGWDAAHDDSPHTSPGALQGAAAAYAFAAAQPDDCARFLELNTKLERPPLRRGWLVLDFLRAVWPWDVKWWKPNTEAPGWRRRCLVKAGALIVAAIEKIDREDARGRLTEAEARQATGV